MVGSLRRKRRDSSDDDDRGGFGGREWRGYSHLEVGTPLDDVVEQDAAPSCNVDGHENTGDGTGDKGGCGTHMDRFSLNNASELGSFKKMVNVNGTDHRIINVFGVRSRSAESHSSSSCSGIPSSRSSSSARSSCSSLSHRLLPLHSRAAKKTTRNSSSTRSDTGLVLRYHVTDRKRRLNNSKFMEVLHL